MYKYIKYNTTLLKIIKSNQKNNIYKLINNDDENNNEDKLNHDIILNRTINRLRYINIYDDILNFSKYIKQEIDSIYYSILNHDIYENFKNIFNKTINNKIKIFNSFSIFLNMYLKYYKNIYFIEDILKKKYKEFYFCKLNKTNKLIKSNIINEIDINYNTLIKKCKYIFYNIKKYINYKINDINIIEQKIKIKIFNMCLINKFTRIYFNIHDMDIKLINYNSIIIKLKSYDLNPIINIIKSFINTNTELFTYWIRFT